MGRGTTSTLEGLRTFVRQSLKAEGDPAWSLNLKRRRRARRAFFNDLRRQDTLRVLAARLQLGVAAGSGHDKEVPVRFLRPRQVLEMIGVSRTTLWRMVQAGNFPRPVCITERNRGYLLKSVEAWMRARAAGCPFDAEAARTARARGGAAGRGMTRLVQRRAG